MKHISVVGHMAVFVAVAFTTGLLIVVVQASTGDFVGGEVGIVWTIAGFAAFWTALTWIPAIRVLRRANLGSAPRRELVPLVGGSILVAILVAVWAL